MLGTNGGKTTGENSENSGKSTELYEMTFPGKLSGRPVINRNGVIIGVFNNVKLRIIPPRFEICFVVKIIDKEVELEARDVVAVNGTVVVNVDSSHVFPDVTINDLIRLQTEVREEIDLQLSALRKTIKRQERNEKELIPVPLFGGEK
ncbi:MAG: hypothetical protein ACFFD4_36290 [Candidatus Odinarchaeota archaeon]